jgi:hydroxypyruvate reductase
MRERLVVTAAIPDQLRQTLSRNYELVEAADRTHEERFEVAVTTSMAGFASALMERIPGLKMIACNGVGLERIDVAAAKRLGIRVCNTPGVLTEDVADAAIGLMFAVARRIVEADRFVRAGRWGPENMGLSHRITGATVGIVGMGRIGQAIARRAHGLGMKVLYNTPRPKPELGWEHVGSLVETARRADVLILACPGGEATRGLVNGAVLEALGPSSFLVNVARGEVVDEEALLAALETNAIAGAALDVFLHEPDIDARFLNLDNVVLQPHYAALTTQTRWDIAAMLDQSIAAFFAENQR